MILKRFLLSKNATAEVIDFVTMMGIIIFSIGMIGVAGFPLLEKAQDARHIDNTKQSFQIMGSNINKIVQGQTPSQSVELKMYGETISMIQNSSKESFMNITLRNSTGSTVFNETYDMGVIEAEFDSATIAYENTGTWAKYDSGGTVIISRPISVLKGDNIYIPVTVVIGSSSNGGEGLIRITAKGITEGMYHYSNITYIKIILNSTYSEGWKKEFESNRWNTSGSVTAWKNFTSPVNVYIIRRTLNVVIES